MLLTVVLAVLCAAVSFTLSATAGLGGSLLLVPALSLLLGTKQGVAVAALLLAANNIGKVIAYRQNIPLKPVMGVLPLTMLGAYAGAELLLKVPESWVTVGVVSTFVMTFVAERAEADRVRQPATPVLALLAGATSGFSGTSGPLKGAALRNLRLDRLEMVGAASAVSLVTDLTKVSVYLNAGLFDTTAWVLLGCMVPLLPPTVLAGRQFNRRMSEPAYSVLFWGVMVGYSVRLFLC
jgi:hypothetical protein